MRRGGGTVPIFDGDRYCLRPHSRVAGAGIATTLQGLARLAIESYKQQLIAKNKNIIEKR